MFNTPFIWIFFVGCLAVSFLFSGMEAGVFALSPLRIRQQMRAGHKSAKALNGYLENPENFLWTILVGNTLANLFILGWLAAVLYHWLPRHRLVLLLLYAVTVFLFYTFFDLLPKMLFRTFPNRLCLRMVGPFRLLRWCLRPLVALVQSVSNLLHGGQSFTWRMFGSRDELRLLMQESGQGLSSEEKTMINRVLDFQNLTVRQVMKPLSQVVTINATAPIQDVLRLCSEHQFSRLPVWGQEAGSRKIAGVVTLNAILFQAGVGGKQVSDYLKPALFLDEELRLEVAMRRMQRSGQRLAIVLGRDRRESGIISLQDVLRSIFGEVSL